MVLTIIKYNAGNIQSVLYALERIGVSATVTDNHEEIQKADKVIFPGVGEASTAMNYLKERKMEKPTVEQIRQRAQEIWLENHQPEGRDDEFWYQAEKELDEKELGDIEPPPTILPG